MRTSKKTVTGITLSEAQEAATTYAKSSIQFDKKTAEMNEKLAAIREKYQPELTELEEAMKEPSDILHNYAVEQRKNWDAKSIELSNCVIGFRMNPPSVAKKRGITWEAVVGLFKGKKALKDFVKVKEDVDKAAILKSQTDTKIVKALAEVGVTIEQDEQFYVDAKKETAQAA